jgi:hypothetical protein
MRYFLFAQMSRYPTNKNVYTGMNGGFVVWNKTVSQNSSDIFGILEEVLSKQ